MKNIFFKIVFTIVLFQCSIFASAMENVVVMDYEGEVKIYLSGTQEMFPCEEGVILKEGYSIQTGDASFLEIAFDGDAKNVLKVKENSNVVLLLAGEDKIDLIDGEVLTVLKNLQKGQEFRIKTPCATCGARGTVWETVTDGNVTNVSVFEGEIALRGINKNGKLMDKEFIVEKGFQRRINKFSDPEKADKIGENRVKDVNKEVDKVLNKRKEFLKRTGTKVESTLPGKYKEPIIGTESIRKEVLPEKDRVIDRDNRLEILDDRSRIQEKQEILSDKVEKITGMQDRIERRETIVEKGEQVKETQRDIVVKRKVDNRIKNIIRRKLLPPPPNG